MNPPDDQPPPPPPLSYRRRGDPRGAHRAPLPTPAGYAIGIALYVATAAAAYALLQSGRFGVEGLLYAVIGVPTVTLVAAGLLEMAFEWRGLTAGAMTAICLTLLIGCFGITVLCGGRR